eukprot:15438093-Alexandrium_andersonii.AAC.1
MDVPLGFGRGRRSLFGRAQEIGRFETSDDQDLSYHSEGARACRRPCETGFAPAGTHVHGRPVEVAVAGG